MIYLKKLNNNSDLCNIFSGLCAFASLKAYQSQDGVNNKWILESGSGTLYNQPAFRI